VNYPLINDVGFLLQHQKKLHTPRYTLRQLCLSLAAALEISPKSVAQEELIEYFQVAAWPNLLCEKAQAGFGKT